MDELDLLSDLHQDGLRQGPGGDDETRLAIALSGLRDSKDLRIADIGCGSGASTLVLAKELDAAIDAVDFLPGLLERLDDAAVRDRLDDRIETHVASMDNLPFEEHSFDAIWSEGAIYNMGFEAGIRAWRRFLKPEGVLAVSELTWLTQSRPDALDRHWMQEYPEVDVASAKMAVLEKNGFSPIGYFTLPERCWIDNYYRPLQDRFEAFLARHDNSVAATHAVAAEKDEIALYERYRAYFGYGFYIAKRTDD